jgi:hypothetical protein
VNNKISKSATALLITGSIAFSQFVSINTNLTSKVDSKTTQQELINKLIKIGIEEANAAEKVTNNAKPKPTAVTTIKKTSKVVPAKVTKLDFKLLKKYPDGSELISVNGKQIKVSKKLINYVKQVENSEPEVDVDSEIKGSNIAPQALPAWAASTATLVATVQAWVGIYSWTGAVFLTRTCGVRPDNCAKTLIAAWQGASWANDQLKNWARGRN